MSHFCSHNQSYQPLKSSLLLKIALFSSESWLSFIRLENWFGVLICGFRSMPSNVCDKETKSLWFILCCYHSQVSWNWDICLSIHICITYILDRINLENLSDFNSQISNCLYFKTQMYTRENNSIFFSDSSTINSRHKIMDIPKPVEHVFINLNLFLEIQMSEWTS